MDEYDKVLAVIRDRFLSQLRKTDMHDMPLQMFGSDRACNLCVSFGAGFLYVYDELWNHIVMYDHFSQLIPAKITIKHLMKLSRNHDIYIGKCSPIKLLSKGETLERLTIEYDMSLKTLDF